MVDVLEWVVAHPLSRAAIFYPVLGSRETLSACSLLTYIHAEIGAIPVAKPP